MVEFAELTKEEQPFFDKITEKVRAAVLEKKCTYGQLDLRMDLLATHVENPLDFQRLAEADDFNFWHDIYGIRNHLNRNTGKLRSGFLPRFTKRETA